MIILEILSSKLRTKMAVFFGIIPCSILVHYDSSLATHCLQAAWKGTSSLVFFSSLLGKVFLLYNHCYKNDIQAEFDQRGRIHRPQRKSAHRIVGWVEFLFTLIVAQAENASRRISNPFFLWSSQNFRVESRVTRGVKILATLEIEWKCVLARKLHLLKRLEKPTWNRPREERKRKWGGEKVLLGAL